MEFTELLAPLGKLMGATLGCLLVVGYFGKKGRVIWMERSLPVGSGIVVYEWEELLLDLVPTLQAAPQPVRVDHM